MTNPNANSGLQWDQAGERLYETGVDRGVLAVRDPETGDYMDPVAWNGLTAINEAPTGGEPTAFYADNIKYLNLMSAEEFGATIEAYTYPDDFALCNGEAVLRGGLAIGQQPRRPFAFSYRTLIGNDLVGNEHGYKIHFVWNAQVAPSERSNPTVNDTPEPTTFSWSVTTTPEQVDGYGFKPTAHMYIDSTKVENQEAFEALLDQLYGRNNVLPHFPSPAEVAAAMAPQGETPAP